ncbi:MAG TPA: CBS domain-containing protein [Bacteroidales bacterium]|jgi:CBS domain-containing protein|nr:CBS domain-containing protein [Bacteroidales bacterium]HNR43049.1 CBS domain-containing protein [Bacteroidales bacterium]HPM18324.1 CBS domain-containing protein [Bacteroidales bacterium]HQG77958.1 CBS domain-containing protein [Bacteroidales bacterium]
MIARDLISEVVPALKTSDSGQTALNWMEIFRISHLPIVNNQDFLGLISDSDIYDMNQPEEPIGNHSLTLLKPYVTDDQHLFEVIGLASRLKLTVVPVLDSHNHYKGVITATDLVRYLASISSIDQSGGILVLEITERDYSLSQIAQIVESNNIKVLSLYITSPPDSTRLEVTLKVNSTDLASLIRTFERYNYDVKTWITSDDSMDRFYSERFDLLMKYLNI